MKYILIGALLAIGWHIVRIIYVIIQDMIMSRLCNTKWYPKIIGKKRKEKETTQKSTKQKIGFV